MPYVLEDKKGGSQHEVHTSLSDVFANEMQAFWTANAFSKQHEKSN